MNKALETTSNNTQLCFSPKNRAGFTLIEVLMVVGIISVLAVALIITINPGEIFREARDSTRIRDMSALEEALSLYEADVWRDPQMGQSQRVYISIPDTSQSCSSHISALPNLPEGWSYRCVTEDNLYNIDGTGWIPVNLTDINLGSPISRLPVDPINDPEQGLYYAYVTGNSYAVATLMESEMQLHSTTRTQGEFDPERYVTGTDITLWRDAYGIVGLWNFDEGSGSIVRDKSGLGNDGSITGSPIWRSGNDCLNSYCLEFTGLDDRVSTPFNPPEDPRNYSLVLHKKTVQEPAGLALFMGGNGGYCNIGFWQNSSVGNISLRSGFRTHSHSSHCPDSTPIGTHAISETLSLGDWHHLVLVMTDNELRYYRNGEELGSTSMQVTQGLKTSALVFNAPRRSWGTGANIDDIFWIISEGRVYERALSSVEIQTMYLSAQ